MLPDHAPSEYADRAILWNAVEKVERYKTAQLAREIEIALPVELSREQNIMLVQRYVKDNFVRQGMCADICIHDVGSGNPHAHIMLTMRPIEKDKSWGAKSQTVDGKKVPTTDWNEHDRAEDWRKAWAAYCNTALRIHGHESIIDHRSYERQGINQVPTIHLGVAASQMERRGIRTERGDINREIEVTNSLLRQLKARIGKLQNWLIEESKNAQSPTLANVIENILSRQNGGVNNLKSAANVLNFLTANNIQDMAGLDEKFSSMIGQQLVIGDKLKPIERRLKTLDEHLRQSENHMSYRGHKARYDKLYSQYETLKKSSGFGAKRKAQKALDAANDYRESHRMEITLYEYAEKYLKQHLNGHGRVPLPTWKEERAKLTGNKKSLTRDYHTLKNDVAEAEKIRRNVYDIISAERRREQPQRDRGWER